MQDASDNPTGAAMPGIGDAAQAELEALVAEIQSLAGAGTVITTMTPEQWAEARAERANNDAGDPA